METVTLTPEFRKTFIKEYTTAIREGDIERVKNIINKKKIDPNFENCYSLDEAGSSNNIEMLKYFLEFVGTNINPLKTVFRSCLNSRNYECALLVSQKMKNIINDKYFDSDFERKHYYYTQFKSEVDFMKELKSEIDPMNSITVVEIDHRFYF